MAQIWGQKWLKSGPRWGPEMAQFWAEMGARNGSILGRDGGPEMAQFWAEMEG